MDETKGRIMFSHLGRDNLKVSYWRQTKKGKGIGPTLRYTYLTHRKVRKGNIITRNSFCTVDWNGNEIHFRRLPYHLGCINSCFENEMGLKLIEDPAALDEFVGIRHG